MSTRNSLGRLEQALGERVTRLWDGRFGVRSLANIEVEESVGAAEACLDFRSSSEAVDRYGEVICASGWRLENYARNPVFQNAHQYGDVRFTLGRALVTEVRGDGLFQRIQFAVEANPIARIAYNLYRGKFLRAVSVGFIPLRWEDGTRGSRWRRRYLEQELLEVSAVAIPANPEALALGVRSGVVEKGDLREAIEILGRVLAGKEEERPGWRALRLARELRDALAS